MATGDVIYAYNKALRRKVSQKSVGTCAEHLQTRGHLNVFVLSDILLGSSVDKTSVIIF